MTNIFAKSWQKMVRIVAGGDTITATNNHPFYLPQLGKYLRADSLRQNMKLLALTGALLTVHAVEAFDTTLQVYNFEVEEYHNYFVGEEGVLVHNDCVFVKAGLRQVDDQGAAVFDRFDEAFATLPLVERQILKEQFCAYLESANDDLLAFFRGTGYVGDLPLAEVQVQRVGAWERLHTLLPENLRHFATDLPHLRFLSHPDVQDALSWLRNPTNGKMNIFEEYPNLLPGELIALNYYTHRGDQINSYFRSGLESVPEHYLFSHEHVANYRPFLNGALDKLPPYEISGPNLWRGTNEYESDLLKSLSIGEEYSPQFYYSTSVEIDVAHNAMIAKGG